MSGKPHPTWLDVPLNQALHHPAPARLFYGPTGVGKGWLLRKLARTGLCTHGTSCGQCPGCRADPKAHPDIWWPPASGLDMAAVRQLHEFVGTRSHSAPGRTVVLPLLDQANRSVCNGLLKALEEPPASVRFLLACQNRSRLPATVVSRCLAQPVTCVDTQAACAWLVQSGVPTADAPILLAASHRAPFAARAWFTDGVWPQRSRLFEVWREAVCQSMPAFEAARHWDQSPFAPLLTWMMGWYADMVRLSLGQPARANPDLSDALSALARQLEARRVLVHYRFLQAMAHPAWSNVNRRRVLALFFSSQLHTDPLVAVLRHQEAFAHV